MEVTSTSGIDKQGSLLASATEDEIFVSQILLELRSLIDIVQYLPGCKWARKKRRSCLDEDAPSSPAPSSPVQRTHVEIEQRKRKVKAAENGDGDGDGDGDAASPVTPLSFFPSESDEKSKRSFKKSSKKKSTKEYNDQIKNLTESKNSLTTELGKVINFYNKQEAYNSQLKAITQEVRNSCHNKKESEVEIGHHHLRVTPHQQLFVAEMAETYQPSFGPITAQFYSSNNGLQSVNDMLTYQLADLNESTEVIFGLGPSQPLDTLEDRRARSAEARGVRRVIMKNKSERSGVKLLGRRR